MDFKLKNFGKIAEADIKLDGITVICGENNTGKSTVGKALFSFYNALNDFKSKIAEQKYNKFMTTVVKHLYTSPGLAPSHVLNDFDTNSTMKYISEHNVPFSTDETKNYLGSFSVKLTESQLKTLVDYLNLSESNILNEYVFRYITNVMNGQIKNVYSSSKSKCSISGIFKKTNTNTISILKDRCKCDINELIEHSAYYINNPFVLDWLNNPERIYVLKSMNPMDRSAVYAIMRAQADINADSMSNILESVQNKKELQAVRGIIKKAYSGETVIDHGRYFYSENGVSVDFRNISAGLKAFAIIERLLETGVLKKKDVLILDEPEIHLHSEWQIIYAELIVILQKTFDLTILLVTHSFQFLESLNFFMKKYEISDKGNYYTPKPNGNGVVMEYFGNNPDELKKSLSTGTFKIADLEYEYDMEQENGDN